MKRPMSLAQRWFVEQTFAWISHNRPWLVTLNATQAALKLMRKLLKKQGVIPATIVTDKLGTYSSALRNFSERNLRGNRSCSMQEG